MYSGPVALHYEIKLCYVMLLFMTDAGSEPMHMNPYTEGTVMAVIFICAI